MYVMLCSIWYHLYNFKNVKNTHGGVLLSEKLQVEAKMNTKISNANNNKNKNKNVQ